MTLARPFLILLTWLALACAATAHADTQPFGDKMIHYSIAPTLYLTPEVASTYGIQRSSTRSLVTIAVLDGPSPTDRPLAATVTGKARDLLGREQPLNFQTIHEQDAIYYIATHDFYNQEQWRFMVEIALENGEQTTLDFSKTLYAE